MQIAEFDALSSVLGGALIGGAAALVMALNGKVAGISGIVGRLLTRRPGDTAWRALFVAGLVGGGALAFRLGGRPAEYVSEAGAARLVVAGLLVGLGTRVGGGCTSGHGVCGLGRLSKRSLVATLCFMAAGFGTVWVTRHLLGGGA